MSYNPSYGGQFQGLSAIQRKDNAAEKKSPGKWVKATAAEGGQGAEKIPKKVICTFKSLTGVKMPPVAEGDRRDFFAAAVFENDDISEVMKSSRSRTSVMPGFIQNDLWMSNFKDGRLVLPIADPSKRVRFYVCAITTTHHEEEGRRTRDIALMGIGYTTSFFLDQCKDYGTSVLELKPVQDGDESIIPGKLEVAVRCCTASEGPAVPADVENSVLETFQAKLDEELKKNTAKS